MARRKKRRSSRSFTLPLAALAGPIITVTDRWPTTNRSIVDAVVSGDWAGVGYEMREHLLGFDNQGKFRPEWIVRGWGPVVLGGLIHKYIGGKLGINAMLGRAGVPLIRV
jgi:hypothetical protein